MKIQAVDFLCDSSLKGHLIVSFLLSACFQVADNYLSTNTFLSSYVNNGKILTEENNIFALPKTIPSENDDPHLNEESNLSFMLEIEVYDHVYSHFFSRTQHMFYSFLNNRLDQWIVYLLQIGVCKSP